MKTTINKLRKVTHFFNENLKPGFMSTEKYLEELRKQSIIERITESENSIRNSEQIIKLLERNTKETGKDNSLRINFHQNKIDESKLNIENYNQIINGQH